MALTILVLTIPAISVTPTADAQNNTSNTSSNLTGQFGRTQAEVEAQCSLSPACIT